MEKIIHPQQIRGTIQIPSSKSDAQRALIAAFLAQGESTIYNYGKSNDEQHLLANIKKMGAIIVSDNPIELFGASKLEFSGKFIIGESGLALRILTFVLALKANNVTVAGTGTLKKRSMRFFDEVLPKLGVNFKSTDGTLPFELSGQIVGTDLEVDGSLSSQYISGLLMALPLASGTSRLKVNNLNSKPYVQMTLNTLAKFGIVIEHKNLEEFVIPGNQHYLSTDYHIEADWSSASCWLVAAALGAEIKIAGLSMSSLQADKQILNALTGAGCSLRFEPDGIFVQGDQRQAFEFDATHCPDLFPALTTLAAFTTGISKIKGANRLKNKESDRANALIKEFGKLGVDIQQEDDLLIIHGTGKISGGVVNSHDDHRIAMCIGVAGLFAPSSVTIRNAGAVSKSYPDFWEHLSLVAIKG